MIMRMQAREVEVGRFSTAGDVMKCGKTCEIGLEREPKRN